MERTQSLYENAVEYNLSESGVQPLTVAELLGDELDAAGLGAPALKYPESNGSALLRERIAAFYPGATLDNVLVPSGGSEANYTTLWGLLDDRTRAAVMIPNYMQSWGLARAFGRRADPYRLVAQREPVGRRWALHVESLERAVSSRTRGRIGWIVGPVKTVAELWSYQDYTTLTPGLLSDRLARRALDQDSASASSPGPAKLSAATFRGWRRGSSAKASCSTTFRPWPCAIAMVKYRAPIGAMRLFDRLRLEKSVLITPGAHFGLAGKYIRIGYGYDIDHTLAGLARVEQLFAELRGPAGSNLTARTGVRPPARAATLLP